MVNLPNEAPSFKLTAVGSKTHEKLMGCQMPDSVQITLISVKLPNRKKESISQCKDIPTYSHFVLTFSSFYLYRFFFYKEVYVKFNSAIQ